MLTPNLTITDAYLMDGAGQRSETAVIGERVGIRFDYRVEGLATGQTYTVDVELDGVTKRKTLNHGAGATSGGFWDGLAGWFVVDKDYLVKVTLDGDGALSESNEADNSLEFTFRPTLANPPFRMVFPLPLEHTKEFSVGSYVDIDNSPGQFMDYFGGQIAYDGHEGIDINAQAMEQADLGIPIVAAAGGTVLYTIDGHSDFGGDGGANGVGIDHGNGWTTHYGHLRKDSVRVSPGQVVTAGEQIGWMGGSGNGVVHLHFEMKHNGRDVDPNVTPLSFWEAPLEYSGNASNVMLIKSTNYEYWLANSSEGSSTFSPVTLFTQGSPETPKFYGRLTGLLPEDEIWWRFYRPNGQLYASWPISIGGPPVNWPHTFKLFTPSMPSVPDLGTWRIAIEVNGTELEEEFITYTTETFAAVRVEDSTGMYLHPSRFRPIEVGSPQTFTITNHGTGLWQLEDVIVPSGFVISQPVPTQLAAGQSAQFSITPDPAASGNSSGFVEIISNDARGSSYRFAVETPVATNSLVFGVEQRVLDEGDTFSANVRRTGELTTPLTVTLSTSDTTRITIPQTIRFDAGESYKRFDIQTTADLDLQGKERVRFLAQATGLLSAQTEVELTESPFLQLDVLAQGDSVREDAGQNGISFQLSRGGTAVDAPLAVSLTANLPSEVEIPASVVIPAGVRTLSFFGTPRNNTIVDGSRFVEIQASANGVGSSSLNVTIVDDDEPGFEIVESGNSTIVHENGGTDTLSVTLSVQPQANVVLGVSVHDSNQISADVSQLTFTPQNWNQPQRINLASVDDSIADGRVMSEITISVQADSSSAEFRQVLPKSVVVIVDDNDSPGFSHTPPVGGLTEAASTLSFPVVLTAQPVSDVVLAVESSDETEVRISGGIIRFTPDNWNVPRTVTLQSVDDSFLDGSQSSTVTVRVVDAQSHDAFDSVPDQSFVVATADDEVAGLLVSGNSAVVSESGTATALTVRLAAAPLTPVTVRLAADDVSEVTVSPGTLVFTPSNWNAARTINLTGVDDDLIDGNQQSVVRLSIDPDASDPLWRTGVTVEISVTNVDNDSVGITVSAISGDTTESGGTATFTVVLNSEPTADVSIGLSSSDTTEGTVTTTPLTFTPLNWNQAQTVTVSGQNDDVDDGDITYSIQVLPAVSSDPLYNGFDANDVSVTNVSVNPPGRLDIDGDGTADAATDGILVLRYLFGFTGDALIAGVIAGGALIRTPAQVEGVLEESLLMLDVDGDGIRDAASDGILLLRFLFGFRDDALVANAVGSGAIRTTGPQVTTWLNQFLAPSSGGSTDSGSGGGASGAVSRSAADSSPAANGSGPETDAETNAVEPAMAGRSVSSSVAAEGQSVAAASSASGTQNVVIDDDDRPELFAPPADEAQVPVVAADDDDVSTWDNAFAERLDWLSIL
ncbi:MAG: peptidoglycan DD-metalloendopeptidase family protein [Planctomycetaceae bacterium]